MVLSWINTLIGSVFSWFIGLCHQKKEKKQCFANFLWEGVLVSMKTHHFFWCNSILHLPPCVILTNGTHNFLCHSQYPARFLTLIIMHLMSYHFWSHNTLITPHINRRLADEGATKCFLNDNNLCASVASGGNPCLAEKMESAADCVEGWRLLAVAFSRGYALTMSLV